MFKALSHFITITKHRHFVLKHCIKAGIPIQGLKHDLSKYSPTEFVQGAKYYVGIKSPNEIEREKRAIPQLGFITKAETDIITNIGWTIIQKPNKWSLLKCLPSI